MDEIEKTLERLNNVLAEAGFPKMEMSTLVKCENGWYGQMHATLQFDKSGKYISLEGVEG